MNVVLGSNPTDPLTNEDLRSLVELIADGTNAHLTVVALSNALFHPKVAHVQRRDGSSVAMVGSANMTGAAFGMNVEAWVEFDDSIPITRTALDDIARAIDRWQTVTETGVYQVRTVDDAVALQELGITISATSRRIRRATTQVTTSSTGRGARRARWRSPVAERGILLEGEVGALEAAAVDEPTARGDSIILRWSKKLSRSDVNKNARAIRNLLSLTKAGIIENLDYFREVFFADQPWQPSTISGHPVEITTIPFNLKLPGRRVRTVALQVVDAPHRESGQHNYRTSIRWGPLAGQLTNAPGQGFTGYWATLERSAGGEFSLKIGREEPEPRRIG